MKYLGVQEIYSEIFRSLPLTLKQLRKKVYMYTHTHIPKIGKSMLKLYN